MSTFVIRLFVCLFVLCSASVSTLHTVFVLCSAIVSTLHTVFVLCSASVSTLQIVSGYSSCESTAKWETGQIFKQDRLLVHV
jgi:hypothetical protein